MKLDNHPCDNCPIKDVGTCEISICPDWEKWFSNQWNKVKEELKSRKGKEVESNGKIRID